MIVEDGKQDSDQHNDGTYRQKFIVAHERKKFGVNETSNEIVGDTMCILCFLGTFRLVFL